MTGLLIYASKTYSLNACVARALSDFLSVALQGKFPYVWRMGVQFPHWVPIFNIAAQRSRSWHCDCLRAMQHLTRAPPKDIMRILLYNPDNGVTRNFMPHLWM